MTEVKEVPLGMREIYPNPGDRAAEALKEQGAEYAFGVHGGHFWPLLDAVSNAGIKLVTFHHEQSGVYAAEAYSRVARKVGVAYATTGPGTGNIVSAVQQAYLNCSPLVLLLSGHNMWDDMTYTLQECYAEDLLKSITKWTKHMRFTYEWKGFIAKAFKDAQAWPKGPVGLEFPIDLFLDAILPAPSYAATMYLGPDGHYAPRWRGDETTEPMTSGGDPKLIEKAVRLIYEAKSPLIYAADGVHWSDGGRALQEFCEMAQVPVCTRRIARGAIPETHRLHLMFGTAKNIAAESDLVIPIGMKVGTFDGHGANWSRCIQINESAAHIWHYLKNTEVAIVGTPAVVLQQMIDCAKSLKLKPSAERKEWAQKLAQQQMENTQGVAARAEKYKSHKPIHFGYLAKVVWDTCEELYGGMNRVVMDGYTISSFAPSIIRCRYSGQYIDCGEQSGVGHGVGMAIGAAFADPEAHKRPVVVFMGDSGMGLAGYDAETAARYKLPIVYVVTNNNGWFTGMKYLSYGKNWEALGEQDRPLGHEFTPELRYDKISEWMGCHGEYVTEPGQIKSAMKRAFKAAEGGKPAVVNVMVDPSINNRECYTIIYTILWGHVPWDKLPKKGKALRRNFLFALPWEEAGVPPMPMPDPWDPITDEEAMP